MSGNAAPEGYNYRYDQLNRLVAQRSRADYTLSSNFAWNTASVGERPHFQEDATYDPNGNILTYRRLGAKSADYLMDSLEYHYGSEDNRLLYITDRQTNYAAYEDDLEDQSSGNYTYDETGNLYEDGYHYHEWTNAQKLAYVSVESDYSLTFRYDATQQNRVAKYETGQGWQRRHYYVRDAQGNVMSTYKLWKHTAMGVTYLDSFKLMEQHIYGSARVGYVQPEQMLYPSVPQNPHALDSCRYTIFEGWKRYEIANHLGNVLAVITDRKRGKGSYDDIEWFAADVLATQQYYPFGMLMPGDTSANVRRQYSLNDYDHRYGFNGKEGDDEVKGDDNQVDFGARPYDPRAGRWLSVDPLEQDYPDISPYTFVANSPIMFVDPDGKRIIIPIGRVMNIGGLNTKKYQNTVMNILKKLTNDDIELIQDTRGSGDFYYVNIKEKRNEINETDNRYKTYGTNLIRILAESQKYNVTIGTPPDGKSGNTTKTVRPGAIGGESGYGIGASSFIQFDENDSEGGVDLYKDTKRPISIGLAHELIHGLLNMLGANDPTRVSEETLKSGTKKSLSVNEIAVRFFENLIRFEQSEAPRVIIPSINDY